MADDRKSDTSNYLEHLRLVHLTLILTSLIAVIATFSQEKSSAARAYEQINTLLEMKERWKGGDWIVAVSREQTPVPAGQIAVNVGDEPSKLFRFIPSIQYLRSDGSPVSRAHDLRLFDRPQLQSDFSDLNHAKYIWNILRDITKAVVPSIVHDGWRLTRSSPPSDAHLSNGKLELTRTKRSEGHSGSAEESLYWLAKNEMYVNALDLIRDKEGASSYFMYPAGRTFRLGSWNEVWIFPAETEEIDVNFLRELKEGITGPGFPVGDFAVAFPDLTELSKHLTNVPPEDLRAHFKEESDRAADKVEFSFFKLPADKLAYAGTGLIFALAMYMCAVLRDFRYRVTQGDKAWGVAWIGISREGCSIAIFWFSMLFPFATALLLIERAANIGADWKVYILGVAVLAFGLVEAGIFLSWSALQETDRSPLELESK